MSFFSKERSIAGPSYPRWFISFSALAIHLCIGQIYAFSVFNAPLTRTIGIDQSTPDDWKLSTVGWIFSIALFCLGASAALFGKWMERVGPRKAMLVAAICFSTGFMVSAIGVEIHNIWLLYLGSGVIGGIGLGLGYISPVSTLIKWFPDRPGMATGIAIMGFGGGAMIASPLSVALMNTFSHDNSTGVSAAFLILGILYFAVMMLGSVTVRIPRKGWQPDGFDPENVQGKKMVTKAHVLADDAIKTPQFYLLFAVLMLNVTAGIGVLGQASVMFQELFSKAGDNSVSVAQAAAFVSFLSLFNMLGRFFWSSISDWIGRKNTYVIFFVLGIGLYTLVPTLGRLSTVIPFMIAFALIISMYGGGFATIPAYLRDLFGTRQVGAIHGRLLLAWSMAALIGPAIINYMREYQIEDLGMAKAEVYSMTMYIMAGLLLIGLLANLAVKPVEEKYQDKS